MFNIEVVKQITISFLGTLLALIFGGIAWLIKSAYQKHVSEILALVRLERMLAENLTLLKDNFEFIDSWISSMKNGRFYSFHYENFILDEDGNHYKVSNLKLINQLLTTNYMLKRTNADINNVYKNYWEMVYKIDAIPDIKKKEEDFKSFHEMVASALENIKNNYQPLENNLVNSIALIRVESHVRFHSLFGYLNILSKDIFPSVNDKVITIQTEKLKENLKKLKQQ